MTDNTQKPPHPKRRKTIVDRHFQLRFALLVLGAAAMFASTVLTDYYAYFGRSVSSNLLDPGLFGVFLAANKPLVLKLVLFLVLIFGGAILMSFRIVGPLFNLRRVCRAVGAGNLAHRARFRDRDEFRDVAAEFNRMMDDIRDGVAEDRRAAEEIAHALERLAHDAADPARKITIDGLREKALLITRRFQLQTPP